MTEAEIARILGVTEPAVNHYMNDRRKPSSNRLSKLASALGVSIDFLLTGKYSEKSTLTDASMLGVSMADFVQVQYEKDGTDSPMEEWGEYAFHSGWLRRLNVPQGTCRLLRIVRDDMEPTLHRGGVALIDPDRQQPDGGIFAFRLDGNLLLRRLAEVDGMISITADNHAYSRMAAKLDRLDIVGQAIWQSSILPHQ